MADALDPLFRPRAIAVLGASRSRGTIAGEVFHNLVTQGFSGPVYPVNASADAVQSVRAYRSIRDVPGEVDLAVIVLPKQHVLEAVTACAEKGVKGLVVISAGFAETGPEGKALQDQLVERVRASGLRMVGPNCLGLLNTDPDFLVNATFAPTFPPSGNVAFSSQSGALGLAILDYARELGIGISQFVSVGNKADVSGNDLLEYWEKDPGTRIVLFYLENLGNPARFQRIARRVSRHKPIVMVKSGRSEAGARAASSHTGALAGLDVAVDAVLSQAGVIRTDTIEELFDVAMLLANQPVPSGDRVAILTNAGGPGIMATDACSSRGLKLPRLSPSTVQALAAFLPKEASIQNPVDMIASASADSYERALRLLLADELIDSVIVLFVPPIVTEANDVAAAIRRAASGEVGRASKPVLTCFLGTHGVPLALSSLRDGRFPSYAFPEAAANALARAVRYGQWLGRPEGRYDRPLGMDLAAARRIVDPGKESRWLTPDEVEALLAALSIRVPRAQLATSAREAVLAAEAIGYPVAMKLVSATITHKTEVGGVELGLASSSAVEQAFERIAASLARLGRAHELGGVLIQEMVTGGVETFVGMTQDASFGPLIAFGIGGVNVELWRDLVFRVYPLSDLDARDMIGQIRGRKLLDGFRGAPPADQAAIADALLRISHLVGELDGICELDLNPLVALPPGQGVVALDARVRIRAR